MQIHRRGVWPDGCGEVVFSCPAVRKMRPVQMTEEGKVRRVRGVAYPLGQLVSGICQCSETILCM